MTPSGMSKPRIYRASSGMWIVRYYMESHGWWLEPRRTWQEALYHVRTLYEVPR
jgi:hypothetical protein